MGISFQRRRLRFTFRLATGSFDKNGSPDIVEFEDLRSFAEISAPGGFQFATCRASVFGVSKSVMDRLTFINYLNLGYMRNVVTIEATDSAGQFSTVFMGEIYSASPNYSGAPNVPFELEARSGIIGSLAPSFANSFPGSRKVSEIMAVLAKELGVSLEDNGVTSVLVDQTLSGSALEKVSRVKEAANIQTWYSPAEGVLAIAPMGSPRKSEPVEVSMFNGMVGWPKKRFEGVEFTNLFDPAMRHGCRIKLESEVPSCNGEWYVGSIYHSLSCNEPGGPWFSTVVANPINLFVRSR